MDIGITGSPLHTCRMSEASFCYQHSFLNHQTFENSIFFWGGGIPYKPYKNKNKQSHGIIALLSKLSFCPKGCS